MRRLVTIFFSLSVLLTATPRAAAAEEVDGRVHIDFDEEAQPGFFGSTTALRDRYEAFGIRFEGANALAGGAILDEEGNFGVTGHSAPNFYAFNSSTIMMDGGVPGFPARFVFPSPVANVNMLVGSGVNGSFTLACHDSAGREVGTANAPLAPAVRPIGIASSGITSCTLTSDAMYLIVDDLSFERAGGHNCVIAPSGRVKCWGGNRDGQLGLGDTDARGDNADEMTALTGIDLGADFVPSEVATGFGYSCAVARDGRVKCWGRNDHGQLGLGDRLSRGDAPNEMGDALPAVPLDGAAEHLALGQAHACAVLTDGGVRCWGSGASGQLGHGAITDIGDDANERPATVSLGTGRRALALAAGKAHTCALLDDHRIKCWGDASQGQLGSGSTASIGASPNQMGDALRPLALGDFTPVAISAGDHYTCARGADGTVRCWGDNSNGQLGLGDGDNRGDADNEMGNNLPLVRLGSGQFASDLACSGSHCCVRFVQHTAKCWGVNSSGQLGLGDRLNRGIDPLALDDELPFTPMQELELVESLHLSPTSTCMKTQHGLLCWGNNLEGELGTGDRLSRGQTLSTTPDQLEPLPL